MKKLDLNQPENIEGGKFWGRVENCNPPEGCYQHCWDTYYVIWIPVSNSNDRINYICD